MVSMVSLWNLYSAVGDLSNLAIQWFHCEALTMLESSILVMVSSITTSKDSKVCEF